MLTTWAVSEFFCRQVDTSTRPGPFTVMGAAGASGKQRVAILPLTTPKNQPDLEQYGLGTMDTLIQALANVPQFVMIDRGRIESILKEQQFAVAG